MPDGEWVGDLPSVETAGGPGGRGGGGGLATGRQAGYGFQSPGRVFNAEQFEALHAPDAKLRFPAPNGSVFIGDKGILTTGTYGEVTRLLPV